MLIVNRIKNHSVQLLAVLLCSAAFAEPRTPTDPNEVLATLSQSRIATNNLPEADTKKLISHYLDTFRQQDDPRYLGRAKGLLARHLETTNKPPSNSMLLLRASIRESEHQFSEALSDLNRITDASPRNAQAWLNKATIQRILGQYEESSESCQQVIAAGQFNLGQSCSLITQSLNGKAEESYAAIKRLSATSRSRETRSWYQAMLGDIAVRLGNNRAAEQHYQNSITLSPNRGYARRELADLLLAEQRADEVLKLLEGRQPSDALLLRITLAKQQREIENSKEIDELNRRYAAAMRRGNNVHLRDQALFELSVTKDYEAALALATENWQAQKEPVDLLTLIRSAKAKNDRSALSDATDWQTARQLEDRRIDAVLSGEVQ